MIEKMDFGFIAIASFMSLIGITMWSGFWKAHIVQKQSVMPILMFLGVIGGIVGLVYLIGLVV